MKVLLAVINAYEENGEFSNFSGVELNHKFGFAIKNIPQMLRDLSELNYIENHTINGFYNRYKILKHIDCPEFVLDNRLSNAQKDFLLRCIEQNITADYIKELLLKQEYKDYYTGLIPESYEDYSIDSNLGYIEGNIVITTNRVNAAKNDMTTEEFKKLISDLYNNISNF